MTTTPITPPSNQALALQTSGTARMDEHPAWSMISHLPVLLVVQVPFSQFRVRDLLALRLGQTFATSWSATDDVPLNAGAQHLAWGEFETVQGRMALRLTRLA